MDSTVDAPRMSGELHALESAPVPGLLVLVDNGVATSKAFPVPRSGLMLGRGSPALCFTNDEWISRAHLKVRRVAGRWIFEDQGSRNGSRLNGEPVQGSRTLEGAVVVRMGHSLCWAVPDVTPHLERRVIAPEVGPILGAQMQQTWSEIDLASRAADTLLIGGPSGVGKELAAQAFHEACHGEGSDAPFIAINCATIPEGLAERLLFGAKRGAYSGATADVEGYIQAANDGTLFLDELAELDLQVQAKLLRVLESREVTALGSVRPQPVNLRICGATLRNVRTEVAEGRFREDLFYRLGRPQVSLSRLAERLDELPFLASRLLRGVDAGLRPSVGLLETCSLRPWPGNVREFLGEMRRAGIAALEAGSSEVKLQHLAADAGIAFSADHPGSVEIGPPNSRRPPGGWPGDDEIHAALARADGNVSGAARELGLHRNQLRRWLERQ